MEAVVAAVVVMVVVAIGVIDRSIRPQGQRAPQRGSLIDLTRPQAFNKSSSFLFSRTS